jgi:adenosylhomocysteine nucleosidase
VIAITFALPAESSSYRRALPQNNSAVEVLHTGVGEKACQHNLANFLQGRQPNYLISAGFAGALSDELRAGDLILGKNLSSIPIDRVESALSGLRLHVGDLYTADTMIESPDQRKAIRQATGAIAVDMETKFISQTCAERGIPMISIRAISDTADEPFPAPSEVLFDLEKQRTNMIKLFSFFLTHPHRIPGLVRFAGTIASARETLTKALIDLQKFEL